tara:strand:+ start:3355 stop:3759 length:405 start_codon:yes stop_codon:yes gene_type:complete
VDTTVSAGNFSTLVAAVQAADLVGALKSDGPFTVFAPTDEAFAKLPAGTIEDLLKPENKDRLTAILTYHVIPGKVTSSDIASDRVSVKTLQGQTLSVDASGGGASVWNALVIASASFVGPTIINGSGFNFRQLH